MMDNLENVFLPPSNFAGLPSPYTDFATAKVVILPVPYDSTTEWHSGARDGPQAIIAASQYLEMYDIELDKEIFRAGIHTLPAIEPVLSSPQKMIQRVYRITKGISQKDKFLVMLGGEHSVSLGVIHALTEKYTNLCVLQLDAHADLRDKYMGTKYNHACIMRRVFEHCPITQVGIRSISWEEQQFLNQHNMRPFYLPQTSTSLAYQQQIINALGDIVYISIDLDVFDPSIMSAVATPEPGGMQWHDVLSLLKLVSEHKHIIGFDIVELCPGQGPAACAFTAAKLAYKLIGYAVP
jgi:agmatinase